VANFNPNIILLDEPTAGLDPLSAEILKEKIVAERKKGKTILITSHIFSELDEIISSLVYFKDGRILFKKTVNEITFETKEEKFDMLMDLLNDKDVTKSIIFVETKVAVDELTKQLASFKYKVGLLHGDRRQRERERTLNDFKEGRIDVLVATDVAARGIDVKEVSQVINYTIPQTYDDYIHRIGRTGRAGKFGKAFTFVKK